MKALIVGLGAIGQHHARNLRTLLGEGVELTAYQMRFHPVLLRLRELLAARSVGNVIAVHAKNGEFQPGRHPYEDDRQSYATHAELGGGGVLTQIHEIAYLLWFLDVRSAIPW